jgi:hypothetical protein
MSPNPTLRQTAVLATTLLLALLLVTAVGLTLASGGPPAWYFTDNLDATGPGDEVTVMEQALPRNRSTFPSSSSPAPTWPTP